MTNELNYRLPKNSFMVLSSETQSIHNGILSSRLSHSGLVIPYGDPNLGHDWMRQWHVAWEYQAITWTNIDFLLVSELRRHSPQSNFTVSAWATILWWWWVWKWYFINSLPHPTGLMSLTFCSSHDIVPYIKSTLVAVAWHSPISAPNNTILHRAGSRFAPSQWETELLCNYVSHWLGTSLESALLHVDHQLHWKVSLQPQVGLL